MKTKFLIKQRGRALFNERGLMNVTLRDVAANLNKSYGNITYHYSTKKVLISALYDDMNEELAALQTAKKTDNLLLYFLSLPAQSFDITLKYLFFTIDYNEIKRNFPVFFARVGEINQRRKVKWSELLQQLNNLGYLRSDLDLAELEYIMFLSSSVRTMYFQFTDISKFEKSQYIKAVNLLLKPYLSPKGLVVYRGYAEVEK